MFWDPDIMAQDRLAKDILAGKVLTLLALLVQSTNADA
jgi:hypothetical protein